MHLLYLDESGSVPDPNQQYFVLAGVCVFERKTHWLEQTLNSVAQEFNVSNSENLELHGSPMRSGREGWRRFPLAKRIEGIKKGLNVIKDNYPGIRLFGVALKKNSLPGQDPIELSFEQISSRFDMFLQRCYTKHNDPQRGIIIFDKASTEQRIQVLSREFKNVGHRWGQIKNFAEVPVFLDSKASRLIQLADLVAFSIFRWKEYQDDSFFSIIEKCFDSEGQANHGLYIHE